MAVTVKKGDVVTASNVHSGTSSKGQYFLCRVTSDSGKDKITIWNNDGFECAEGASVKVLEILSARKYKRQYNDKWYDETDLTCSLKLAEPPSESSPGLSGFGEITENEGNLPF